MPVRKGVGANKYSTPLKQIALNGLMGYLIGTTARVARKRGVPAVVFDMTCGLGLYDDQREGSPLIMARHVAFAQEHIGPIDLVCVDRKPHHIASLSSVLRGRYPAMPVRYEHDQRAALTGISPKAVGLAYFDPTRYTDLDPQLLHEMGQQFPTVDILFTRECLASRRMGAALHTRENTITIKQYLDATGKQCRYWAEFAKWQWWSLAFADNWEQRDTEKLRWPGGGRLVPVDSAEGQRLFARWTGEDTKPWEMQPLWP